MIKNITDEIYYHINTGQKLQIGDILEIGKRFNNFYYEIYNIEHIEDNKDANQYLIDMKKEKNLLLNNDTLNLVFKTINDSAMITRELVFEEVRKELNPNLPSRLKCLYVCKTKNEIKDWINIFSRTNKKDFQIVKLKLTGNIFTGDASFILRQNISLNRKKKQAKMYWNGEKKDNINEYLFIGTAVVEDILKIEDFQNEINRIESNKNELNKKWQEQKQYENLSFTVDDLLIIQDKQQINEFMNPYLFFININKWLETPKDKKTKVICKIYRLYHNR